MAVNYATTVKAGRMTATRDAHVNGTLELLSASDAVLASFTLSGTGGTVTNAVWTLGFVSGTVSGTVAAGAGVAATKAQIKNSGGTAITTGLTVGASGTDVILNNVNIAEGQTVTLTSATVTHAA